MILKAKIINSDAVLNNFIYISNAEFLAGSTLTMAFVLWNQEKNIRHVLPSTATVTVHFPRANDILDKAASAIDVGDRSMWKTALTSEETEDLLGGNVTFTIDVLGDATQIIKGYINQATSRVTAGQGGC
jgi:hypothetical protein